MTGISLAVEAMKERIEENNELFDKLERINKQQNEGFGLS
jgi:hypothetical protein